MAVSRWIAGFKVVYPLVVIAVIGAKNTDGGFLCFQLLVSKANIRY